MTTGRARTAELDRRAEDAALPPVKSRRAYPRKDDVVLEAAEKCFLEVGYASTSMDAVAERAGVSKRTIYSNFKSKESLFAAVVRKSCADVLPYALDEVDVHTDDPEATLRDLAEKFLTDIYSKPRVQMYQTVVAASRRFPEIGAMMFETSILQSQQVFDSFLRAQVDVGQLAFPDLNVAAAQLVALLKTDLHVQLLFNQPAKVSAREIKKSASASVRLFLNGARVR